jgi:hypothetical protein
VLTDTKRNDKEMAEAAHMGAANLDELMDIVDVIGH